MRYFYSLLWYLLTPYLVLRLWYKGRKLPAYRERIAERFCLDKAPVRTYDIWLHAVSLGEVIAATPVIEAFLSKNCNVLFTTMTPTGSMQAQKSFGNRVAHRYLPYDIPQAVKCFFKKHKPRVGVIVETEIWPNLITQASKLGIPLFLVNARLSLQSYDQYYKLRFWFKPLLNAFTAILTQSADDTERFLSLGADKNRVSTLGNIKFDLQTNSIEPQIFLNLKRQWGCKRVVLIAASTHEEEEQQLLSQLKIMQQAINGLLLLIAPRHPERFQKIFSLAQNMGFNTALRSQHSSIQANNEVIVLDSMGELLGFYLTSDYAFVGGSLVPKGGHNVLEPIAMGVPVVTGSYVDNFKTICENLEKEGAIEIVTSSSQFADTIIGLHTHPEKRKKLIDNASSVLNANKGAVMGCVSRVEAAL